eukprot:IDg3408t1
MKWREEDASRKEKDTAILHKILDCNLELLKQQSVANRQMATGVPESSSVDLVTCVTIAQIYAASADPSCSIIQAAAHFALPDATFCPDKCPLRTTSNSSADEKAKFARQAVQSAVHKRDSAFDSAWYHSSQIACIKARLAAQSTFKEEATDGTLTMTVCSFAFIITKVTFALQRLFSSSAVRKELRKSHRIPWAVEALRIDQVLSSQECSDLQIGRITFPNRLTIEQRTALSKIASASNLT